MLGGIGMHQAHFPTSIAESALDWSVVFASAFDDHDEIANRMFGLGLTDAVNGGRKVATRMAECGGLKDEVAVEIREQVARACLGAIDTDKAKMLWSHSLHALREAALRLLDETDLGRLASTPTSGSGHNCSLQGAKDQIPFPSWSRMVEKPKIHFFLNLNRHTTDVIFLA